MQVIFQTGAHSTEHERLLKCLLANKENFSAHGVAVPGPGRYRPLLRDTLEAMTRADPAPDARDVLVDTILDNEKADRVILLNTHFLGTQRDAIGDNRFYPLAEQKIGQLRQLFEFDQVEVFMAVRNPAAFVPSVLTSAPKPRAQAIMNSLDPTALQWSELVSRVRDSIPDVSLTLWCNEDAPLIWAQLLREIAGLEHGAQVEGEYSLLDEIMTPEGMKRFRAYLGQQPDMTEMHLRRIIAAFLDKFAKEDAVEEEIDLPGWTEDLVDELTDLYDEDVHAIQRIPGVQFIAP